MDYTLITRLIIFFVAIVVVMWDSFLIFRGHTDATFSVVLYESARDFPVISFIAGFLCGHVFWQVYSSRL
jgi:hypothetical protein